MATTHVPNPNREYIITNVRGTGLRAWLDEYCRTRDRTKSEIMRSLLRMFKIYVEKQYHGGKRGICAFLGDVASEESLEELQLKIAKMETAMRRCRDLLLRLPNGIDQTAGSDDSTPEDMAEHIGGLIYNELCAFVGGE